MATGHGRHANAVHPSPHGRHANAGHPSPHGRHADAGHLSRCPCPSNSPQFRTCQTGRAPGLVCRNSRSVSAHSGHRSNVLPCTASGMQRGKRVLRPSLKAAACVQKVKSRPSGHRITAMILHGIGDATGRRVAPLGGASWICEAPMQATGNGVPPVQAFPQKVKKISGYPLAARAPATVCTVVKNCACPSQSALWLRDAGDGLRRSAGLPLKSMACGGIQ